MPARPLVEHFLGMIPINVWDKLVTAVNRNLAHGQHVHQYDSRRKSTTVKELQNLYGIIILIENTYGNATLKLKKHFAQLKQQNLDVWPQIGVDHFSALLRYI